MGINRISACRGGTRRNASDDRSQRHRTETSAGRSWFDTVQKPFDGRLHEGLGASLDPRVHMRFQEERGTFFRRQRAVRKVPQRQRPYFQKPVLGAAFAFLPSRFDRVPVNRVGLPGTHDRPRPNDPGSRRTAGSLRKHSATIEATEALAEAVHCGALGNEGVEAEVRADLDGLGRNDDGKPVSAPITVGIDDGTNPVQGIDPIQRTHASGDDMRVEIFPRKQFKRLASRAHPIHDDSHAANLRLVPTDGFGDRLDDLQHRHRNRLPIRHRHELRMLGRLHAVPQLRAPIQVGFGIQGETFGLLVARRRRHFNRAESPRQRLRAAQRGHLGKGLRERYAQMHFIQDHEAVVAGEPGMNRPHARRDSVPSEQKAGAELVHRGDHYPGLIRPVRPITVERDPTPQCGDAQGLTAAQVSQSIPNPFQNRRISRLQTLLNSPCSLMDLIDDDPPVYHEHDAAGGKSPAVRP